MKRARDPSPKRFCRPPRQSSIASTPIAQSCSRWSFIALRASGECPFQSRTSPVTRSGSQKRYDLVGLPANFLSVRFGSSIFSVWANSRNATPLIAGNRHLFAVVSFRMVHAATSKMADVCSQCCYSSLSATFASSRDARHAGSQLATAATTVIVAITKAIVTISVGCTPNSSDAIRRFKASAPARPKVTPKLTP